MNLLDDADKAEGQSIRHIPIAWEIDQEPRVVDNEVIYTLCFACMQDAHLSMAENLGAKA